MSKPTVVAFMKALLDAVSSSRANMPVQQSVCDFRQFRLSVRATEYELYDFFREVHNYLVTIASAVLDLDPEFVRPKGAERPARGIPVTCVVDSPLDLAYYMIVLFDPLDVKGPTVQVPVRISDLYCCGFRVFKEGDDLVTKKWFSFGSTSELPKRLFPKSTESGFTISYNSTTSIKIHNKVLLLLYKMILSIPAEGLPNPKDEFKILKDTLFFLSSETQRFHCAQEVSMRGIVSPFNRPARVTLNHGGVLNEWSDTSVGVLYLWLAQIEKDMAYEFFGKDDHRYDQMNTLHLESMEEAKRYLDSAQGGQYNDLTSVMPLRRPDGRTYCLRRVPRFFYLMKSSDIVVLMVIMRKDGFRKKFLEILEKPSLVNSPELGESSGTKSKASWK